MKPLFLDYDLYLVRWIEALAEKHGISIDYASNHDIHRDRSLAPWLPSEIGSSHDEYWTKEEYDAYEERIHVHGKKETRSSSARTPLIGKFAILT